MEIKDISKAQEKLNEVQSMASDVNEILVKVREPILSDKNGNVKIKIDKNQEDELLEEYETRKQSLISSVNNLL